MAGLAFNGNANHTIDPKGRATIPAIFREALGEGFTLGLNRDLQALALYPADEWKRISDDVERIPTVDARAMRYRRLILGFSFPNCTLDGQGRVLLPQTLRQKVGMDKSVRFVGVGPYLEIWPEDKFLIEAEGTEADRDDLLEYVRNQYYAPPQ